MNRRKRRNNFSRKEKKLHFFFLFLITLKGTFYKKDIFLFYFEMIKSLGICHYYGSIKQGYFLIKLLSSRYCVELPILPASPNTVRVKRRLGGGG